MKCVAWFLQRFDHFISLPFGFLIFDSCFHTLGALMGSTSFVVEALHKDLGMIFNFLMLADP